MVSNLTGTWHGGTAGRCLLVQPCSATVRFADGVRALAEAGMTHFLEIGPHSVLARLGPACLRPDQATWLDSLRRGQ